MSVCSWIPGCAQETSKGVELCEYHEKVSGGLLGESGEVAKVASRKLLKRQGGSHGAHDSGPGLRS